MGYAKEKMGFHRNKMGKNRFGVGYVGSKRVKIGFGWARMG